MTIQRIIQQHGTEYLERHPHLTLLKRGVLKDLAACRTGAYGGHLRQCDACGWSETLPNSCRNRHCGTCGGAARAKWYDELVPKLLPTSYFQIVFTLPHELIPLTLTQPRVLYKMLFHTAWATLQQLAVDPQYLGARLGALAVLHTWNQELQPHPHVHFVLPAGGLSVDGTAWIPFHRLKSKQPDQQGAYYFVPHKVLSRLFRGKFLAALRAAYDSGELILPLLPERWRERPQFEQRCHELSVLEWVAYQESPPPDLEPTALVKYLARYVSGVAISDQRLVSCEQGQVTFKVKNRNEHGRREERTIGVSDFLSRLLQHVLPTGFKRIRYYGFLSSGNRSQREHCRKLLLASSAVATAAGDEPTTVASAGSQPTSTLLAAPGSVTPPGHAAALLCSNCHQKVLRVVSTWPVPKWRVRAAPLCRVSACMLPRVSLPTPSLPHRTSSSVVVSLEDSS